MTDNDEIAGWRLRSARPRRPDTPSSWLPEDFLNLAQREEEAGLRNDELFLLKPDGHPDLDVSAYLHDRSFRRLSRATQVSYAKDLRTHFNFLYSQHIGWRECTVEVFEDYEYWRRRDERNPSRISGAKFSRELATCRRFYEWHARRGTIRASPIETFTDDSAENRAGVSVPLMPKNARNNRVKWLTPEAYRQWKHVVCPATTWKAGRGTTGAGGTKTATSALLTCSGIPGFAFVKLQRCYGARSQLSKNARTSTRRGWRPQWRKAEVVTSGCRGQPCKASGPTR